MFPERWLTCPWETQQRGGRLFLVEPAMIGADFTNRNIWHWYHRTDNQQIYVLRKLGRRSAP